MIKKRIAGYNAEPGKPENWNEERDGECKGLAVKVTIYSDGTVAYSESAWELTPIELNELNKGGQVILRVQGWQVPVALYVQPLPAEEPL